MESNRESARRSRLKKEQRILDLTREIAVLKNQITEGNNKGNNMVQKTRMLVSENTGLESEKTALDHYFGELCFMYASLKQEKQIGPEKPTGKT